ncbi:MAG: type I-E CRISPR-associated protein Cas5/CasD [Bacillota bacterium]
MISQPLLLLRLEGPLQSWGLRARWDIRDSGSEPSKSGLIGLLGCALGYGLYDPRLEELDRQFTLGVRVENPGRQMVDYHTIFERSIISPRTYLQDAAFLAVFTGPEELLQKCRNALANPHWPIYLGRKSCPSTRPVLEGLIYEYASIKEALQNYPWDWEAKDCLKKLPDKLYCIIEDPEGAAQRPDRIRVNPARMYDNRRVSVFWTKFPGVKEVSPCTSPA